MALVRFNSTFTRRCYLKPRSFRRRYAVDLESVKALRKKTLAAVNDCYKALQDSNGDIDAAAEWLQKRLQEKGVKREGRETAERCVCVMRENRGPLQRAVLLSLNAETDFAARSTKFIALTRRMSKLALSLPIEECTVDAMLGQKDPETNNTFDESFKTLRGTNPISIKLLTRVGQIKENIKLEAVHRLEAPLVASYMNTVFEKSEPPVAIAASIVAFDTPEPEKFSKFGREMAVQVLSMYPTCITADKLPEGGNKEDVLMDQQFYKEPMPVKDIINKKVVEIGAPLSLLDFKYVAEEE